MTRPTSKDRLTRPQRKFAKRKALGDNNTDAARKAYPATKYPTTMGHALSKQPDIIAKIGEYRERQIQAFRDQGITEHRKAEVYKEILDESADYTKLKALDQINKIDRSYESDKPELHLHAHSHSFIDQLSDDAQEDL